MQSSQMRSKQIVSGTLTVTGKSALDQCGDLVIVDFIASSAFARADKANVGPPQSRAVAAGPALESSAPARPETALARARRWQTEHR